MRVVTLNVRNPSFDDGQNAWPHRSEAFFETLRRLDPDVLCLQETIVSHVDELLDWLKGRVAFGLPREDGENAEMCALVVREGAAVTCSDTEWLSPTPRVVGSKGWGAVCPRVVTWIDFGDWTILNAHLDHISLEARINGIRPIIALADALGKPCLMTGDFNAEPDEPALQLAREAGFVDLAEGTGPTYHGFGQGPFSRIDYILARGPWCCERAWVEKGDYSDHWAVVADLDLQQP